MTIDFKQVFDWMLSHWAVCTFALSTLIQVTPIIKVNPYTALFRWIGKLMNSEIITKLDKVQQDVNSTKAGLEEVKRQRMDDEKDRIRWEILDFANSLRNGGAHTKDEFQHIFALNDKYEKLLELTNDTNGVFEVEYEFIKKTYARIQDENAFLS